MTASKTDQLSHHTQPTALFTKWLAAGLFCTISLLPLFQAALISTSTETASGRFGLILPVLLLADDTALALLVQLFISAGLNLGFVAGMGLFMGLTAAGTRSRLMRGLFQLAFWPASLPVWLWPLVLVAFGQSALFTLNDRQKLLFWLFWVGWWGSMRLASEIQALVQLIDKSMFESCQALGGGPWQAFRLVIRPVIHDNLQQTLTLTTAILIFDPTPALLAGVQNWPVAIVVDQMRQPVGPGLYVAASWLLMMGLVMIFYSFMINWLAGRRSIDSARSASAHTAPRNAGHNFFSRATPLALFALWPWVLLIASGRLRLAEIGPQLQLTVFADFNSKLHFILPMLALLAICIFASFLFHQQSISRGLEESAYFLTAFQPMLIPAFAIQAVWAWSIAWKFPIELAGSPVFWQIFSLICVMIMAMGLVARRQKSSTANKLNRELQKARVEAAITLGASPAQARKMAGIAGDSARSSTAQVAALFEQAWWLATAPAWVLVMPLVISGQLPIAFLTEFATNQNRPDLIQNIIYMIIPGLLARVTSKLC